MIRLLIADDHAIIATGVAALLRDTAYEIVSHVRDGGTALAAIAEVQPDIVILDERLPGMTGLAIFRALRAKGDLRPVVLLSGTLPERRAIEAIEAGVNGLVLKHDAPDRLLHCLDEVLAGRRWIEQHLLQRALDHATGQPSSNGPLSRLTPRERAIVEMVGDNHRTRAIAEKLGISEGTVKVHLHNAYEKLGVSSRIEIVLLIRDMA
jgi:two-component system nitrate/nitrite response regulator NarP